MKNNFTKELTAGLFFMIGLILMVFLLFFVGSKEGFARPKFSLEVLFKNVGGLEVGAPVRLSGVNVGSVAKVDFIEQPVTDRKVRVVLSIYEKYKNQVMRCSDFSIKTAGILGDKLIEIAPPEEGMICEIKKPLIGKDPLDIQNWAENLQETSDSFRKLSEETTKITKQLNYVSYTFKRLLDRIEDKLIKGNLLKVF
ncbi:MAG: MlaD family protein [Candidatus Omnitrophica bacterium]|nr:MlaD family protein [Candidatus Omnitrophota bacterium]